MYQRTCMLTEMEGSSRVEFNWPLPNNCMTYCCATTKTELFSFLSQVVGGLQQPTGKKVISMFNNAVEQSFHETSRTCHRWCSSITHVEAADVSNIGPVYSNGM